jgi:hypothetical protein
MGDQMAVQGPGDLQRVGSDQKVRVLKENGTIVFTKEYVKHTLLSKKTYTQGTAGIVTDWQTGLFGEITHVDIRLKDGKFVRGVPVDYFRA